MSAVVERELAAIAESRAAARGAAPAVTVAALVEHYERYGDLILKVYAESRFVEGLDAVVDAGRQFHLGWCREAFAGHLRDAGSVADSDQLLAQVVVACDATSWRILRRDLGLDPDRTRRAIEGLLGPALADGSRLHHRHYRLRPSRHRPPAPPAFRRAGLDGGPCR